MKDSRKKKAEAILGPGAVDMLIRSHQDALWMLENMGVACRQPEIVAAFAPFEADGTAIVYEDRIYVSGDLVEKCLATVPGIDDFFVPRNSFFIGGTAPYIYDDAAGEGGVMPTTADVARIADTVERTDVIAGMGRGVKLKDEVLQIETMAGHCTKPLYFAVTSEASLARAKKLWEARGNCMVVFCLTRPPLAVNENFSDFFVKTVRAGLPVFISAMPMAGVSAPYCYNGVLAMTHAEVLFGICAAQLLNPGATVVHGGFPTIADPRFDYNPNYGLRCHFLLNLLMAHLNMMLDLPTIQSGATTNEAHVTQKALDDARDGQAMALKYGFHMLRHPFAFLQHLVDFSFEKLEKTIHIAGTVTADMAPEVPMPVYDPRAMDAIQRVGLGMYLDDPLTTANIGVAFLE